MGAQHRIGPGSDARDAGARAERLVPLIAVLLLGLSAWRAHALSLTHDEALTYSSHVQGSLREILRFEGWIPSNNHLLNTLAMKACVRLFGDGELALRLPALAGGALYLWSVARLLRRFTHGWVRVLGYLLACANPYLLDFFSIARGYGLALGFLALALDAFVAGLLEPEDGGRRRRRLAAAIGAALVASLANLGFGIPFLGLVGAVGLLELRACWRARRASAVGFLAPAGSLVLFRLVYDAHNLDRIRSQVRNFGGESGFWIDSLGSVVHAALYDPHLPYRPLAPLAAVPLALVFTHALLHLLRLRRTRRPRPAHRVLLGLGLLWGSVLAGVHLQRAVFGLPFPVGRGVLYLWPLLVLVFVAGWQLATELPRGRSRQLLGLACTLLAVGVVGSSLSSLNLTHTLRWRYDADTRAAVREIARLYPRPAPGSPRLRLGVNSVLEPSTNYYLRRLDLDWFEPTRRKERLDGSHDVYLLRDETWLERTGLRLVRAYPVSGTCIAAP